MSDPKSVAERWVQRREYGMGSPVPASAFRGTLVWASVELAAAWRRVWRPAWYRLKKALS